MTVPSNGNSQTPESTEMFRDVGASQHGAEEEAVASLLRRQEERIANLEKARDKGLFKRITESASASALFLGLVLTFATLYDVFVRKPESDRLSLLSQFNQAVNSAAKTRQELIQLQTQTADPTLKLAISLQVTPQILNDIATARAILPDLRRKDVGVSQLIILISESFTTGDLESAKVFVERAVKKTDATPLVRAEAKRYEGKYLFLSGAPAAARQSYMDAISILGDRPAALLPRAIDLADLVIFEYMFGECGQAGSDFASFLRLMQSPPVNLQTRREIGGTVQAQLATLQGQHCPQPVNLDVLSTNAQQPIMPGVAAVPGLSR